MENTGSVSIVPIPSQSDAEESGGASGWSIADVLQYRFGALGIFTGDFLDDTVESRAVLIRVNGTLTPNTAAVGAPTITGTAQVGETLTAVTTGITDADGLTSPTYTYQWIRGNGTEADIAGANSSTYTLDAADQGKTIKVKVSFTDDASNTETLTSAATVTVSAAANNAPVFATDTASRSFTETVGNEPVDTQVVSDKTVGAVVTATDADGDTLTYSLEGTDAAKFGIVSSSGQIYTQSGFKYDREAKASYSVTVKADDGNGGSDTIAVTINVDNEVEKPVAPAMPTVTATSGSTTSLDVSWTAPANTGRPAITGYKVEYRPGVSGNWITHAHAGTGRTTTITSLTAATSYQVHVLAVNSDGDGAFSSPGAGTTGTPNTAPTVANAISDQTATVGTALTYAFPANTFNDADSDTLTYTATKSDDTALPSWLSFAAATRAFSGTPQAADVETVSVKVTASDGNGGSVSDTFDIVVSPPADTTAPRVASIVRGTPSSSPTNADSLTWRVTFSEAVSNVDTADFAVSGTTATLSVSAVSGVTGAYDVTASGGNLAGVTATVTLSIASGHNIQDAASNALTNTTPTGANDNSYVVDNTAPTVTITGVPGTSSAAFTATFTFTEAVTGFVVGDITLGNATASSFMVTSTTVYTALITPTANGAVTVDVAADVALDAAGNGNTAATRASSTYTMPVPTITIAAGTTPVTEGASAAFTLTRSGGPPGNPELTVNVSVTETQDMVAAADKGAKTVIFQANSATAMLGVATVADSVDETDSVVTVTDDDTRGVTVSAPTLAVNEGSSGTYTVVLDSEPTASVTVTPSSGNSDVTVSSALTFTTMNWSTAQMVTVTAAHDSDAVDDSATISHAVEGGDYGAVTAASVTVTVDDDETADTTAPRVASIVRGTPSSSPTNADSLTWRVTFSEAVSNVDTADFAVSGTTATLSVSAVSGVTGAYDVTASGGNLAGVTATVTLSIASGHNIQDAASNALTNTTPTGANDNSYVVDNTAPTVTITGVPGTSSAAFTATFTFTEAVTGFVVGDITLGNATASSFMVTSTTVYTALITPTANGAVTVDVAADVALDAAGNGNTAATRASSTYTASSANNAPTVANAISDQTATAGTALSYAFPANTFNDADSDPLTYAATKSDDTALPSWLSFAAATRTFSGTPTAADVGTVSVKVTASDGNGGSVSDTFDIVVSAAANNAAMGAPTITGTAQVGETLTEGTTGITDADGLTSPGYTYQWIRVNGTEADIASANSSTYILVAADLGKTIKVKVSFTDDASNAETLTSAASGTVTTDVAPPPPPNTAPEVAIPLADQEVMVDVPFTYVVPADAFTDADGNRLTYAAALSDGGMLPSWLTFDPATRTFTGTPASSDSGPVRVTVMVSDGTATVSDEFALMVTVGNTAPEVAIPLADQEVMVDVPFTYVVPADAFTDADGNPLTYAAALSDGGMLPGWLTFDPATRTFRARRVRATVGPCA